jgi:SAM-dependent methyltransferase
MHAEAYAFVRQVASGWPLPDGLVVEIGGRNINGTARDHFTGRPYIATDIAPGLGVDVVADGARYVPPEPAAVVVCCEVLEHADNGADICANAERMLKPGGVLIITAAGEGRAPHSAVDGGALQPNEYYDNVTESTLRAWLAPFKTASVFTNAAAGDIYAVATRAL